jgi:hypothetical protein
MSSGVDYARVSGVSGVSAVSSRPYLVYCLGLNLRTFHPPETSKLTSSSLPPRARLFTWLHVYLFLFLP